MAQDKHKNQVAPSIEGRPMPPELLIQPREQRDNVVLGTNEPVSPEFVRESIKWWLAFITIVGMCLAAISYGLGLPVLIVLAMYLALAVVVSLAMWNKVLPYMTGDNVAEKEIDRKQRVEIRHIEAEENVRMGWIKLEGDRAQAWREVELARIQRQQDQLDISARIARLEQAQLDSLHMSPPDRGRNFVPAHDLSAKLRVKEWLEELYDDPNGITSTGKVRAKMPQWTREEEAYILKLFEAPTKQGEWWGVVYDDKYDALMALNNMDKGEW